MALFALPLGNVPLAIASTAFVAIPRALEVAKRVQPRKNRKGLMEPAVPLPQPKIPMANALAVIAMAPAPVRFTMAQPVAPQRNACPAIASMAFVAAMLVPVRVWPVPPPNAAPASTANADPLPPIQIPTTNAPMPNAVVRAPAIWRKA